MIDKDFDKDIENKDNEFDDDDIGTEAVSHNSAMVIGGTTPVDLARLGLSEIAYIRRAIVNDMPMWTIHSAAGDPLGAAHSFDQAWAAVKQNDMEPVRVH